MRALTAIACFVAVGSGMIVADSARLFPPLLTTVFAISAAVSIYGLLKLNKKYGR